MLLVVGPIRMPLAVLLGDGEALRLRLKGDDRKRDVREGWAAFCLRLKETLRLISHCHAARILYLVAPSV